MGLDITIETDNSEELFEELLLNKEHEYFEKLSLSRSFCNFTCRHAVVSHEPELQQIANISGVDVLPIMNMLNYPDEEGHEFLLQRAANDEERNALIQEAEDQKRKLTGNIDRVLATVASLNQKLNTIPNLPELLLETNFDTLNNKTYFRDYKKDVGEHKSENNFGQDMRAFKRFLDFAKSRNTKTVWFRYG